MAARSASTVGRGIAARDEPRGDLVQDAGGLAVLAAPDHAARPDRASTRPTPPAASAAWLASSAWWSCAQSATRRPGAARSRSSAVGQRPRRSASQPAPSIHASAAGCAAAAARTRATSTSIESASSSWTLAARQRRLDEVQVGVGQARDGRLVRPELDDARARSGRGLDVADASRPPRRARRAIAIASTQPGPSSPARVAIRPRTTRVACGTAALRWSGGVDDRVVVAVLGGRGRGGG